MDYKTNITLTPLRYPKRIFLAFGLYIGLVMIGYFLLCYFLGVIHISYLRAFNFFILAAGAYGSMRQFRLTHGHHVNYFRAAAMGIASSFIGVTIFIIFFFILLKIDGPLFTSVVTHEPLGGFLNIYAVTAVIWIEGIFAGTMATYMVINVIKTDS